MVGNPPRPDMVFEFRTDDHTYKVEIYPSSTDNPPWALGADQPGVVRLGVTPDSHERTIAPGFQYDIAAARAAIAKHPTLDSVRAEHGIKENCTRFLR